MSPSLPIALPPIYRITKRETTTSKKVHHKLPHHINTTNKHHQQFKPSSNRNHVRTTSVPLNFSSIPFQQQQKNEKLSMDILLDAIDLDQQMRQFFRSEVMKSKNRSSSSTFTPSSSSTMMARRRSKSAPGAPPSYHQQRAFSAVQWMTPNSTIAVTSSNQAEQIAKFIVQQHIEAVKKR